MDTAVFNFHCPLKQDEFFPNRIPDDESAVCSLSLTLRFVIDILPPPHYPRRVSLILKSNLAGVQIINDSLASITTSWITSSVSTF